MLIHLPEMKTFDPRPRRCIYRWPKANPPGPFGREHIIARNLGGKLVLRNASCRACEGLINREIETPVLSQTWVSPRAHLGLPSSKPKTTSRIGRWTDNGEELPSNFAGLSFRFEEVPLPDRAFVIMLLDLLPPGILEGRAPTEKFPATGMAIHASGPWAEPNPGERVGIFEPFDPVVLGRFLAKVAHGAAVASFGLDGFEPFLPDLIKGNAAEISHHVGGSGKRGRRRPALHRVALGTRCGLLLADIQLFAKFGLPPYQVVVGRLAGDLAKWHMSSRATVSMPAQWNSRVERSSSSQPFA